jgi:hypothetical protein
MSVVKRLILLLLFTAVVKGLKETNDDAVASIKSVKCKTAENFAYPNVSCFAKSYSRTVSTINIYILARQPMTEIFVGI